MDAQELRNLQEAYIEVYALDEAKVDTGLSDVAKKDIRSRRYVSKTKGSEGVKNYDAMGSNASNWVSAERRRVHKASRGVRKEEIDLFDYLLEYLVAEGYADTNEAALVIMANMSEDWREDIIEGYVDWQKGSLTVPSRVQGNKRTESPYERAGRSQFKKMADAQTTRGTQAVRGARGRKAKLAAKQSDVIQQVTQKYHNK